MPPRRNKPSEAPRQAIAQEAARLLAQHACADYRSARQKAAARLGCRDQRRLPDNREIAQALQSYQQLFQADSQRDALDRMRRTALQAMQSLSTFDPHLTGEVLDGTANRYSPIRLYLFADTAEQLALHLMERRIPFRQRDTRLSYSGGVRQSRPLFRFQAGEAEIELICLPPTDRSNPPLDSLLERPSLGIGPGRLQALVDDPAAAAGAD